MDELRAQRALLEEINVKLSGRAEDLLSLNQIEKQYQASRSEIRAAIKRGKLPAREKVVQGGKKSHVVRRADAAAMFRVRA